MPIDLEKKRLRLQRWREANRENIRAKYREKQARGGLVEYYAKYRKENAAKLKISDRRKALRRKYGITPEQFDAMAEKQNGRCAICQTTEPKGTGTWHVDHSHKTGKVRGLLCAACNLVLGRFENNPGLLEAMIVYLNAPDVEN